MHFKSAVIQHAVHSFDSDFKQNAMFSIESFIERTLFERIHTARRQPFLNGHCVEKTAHL